MSTLTDAMWDAAGLLGLPAYDGQSAVTTASSNLTGVTPRVLSQVNRFTIVPATATAVLPSLLTGETNGPSITVLNAGINALTVYAYADVGGHAEKINNTASTFGGATGGLSIAAGSAATFVAEDIPKGRGGAATANNLNWSASVLS